jgi:HEAT repeat protein
MAMNKSSLLQRLFNIYPGEEKNSFLFACLGFIWAFGATCGLKFADALFLLHVGAESLPKAYVLNSCGMFTMACILLYSFNRFSSYTIFRSVLVLGITFYGIALVYLLLGFATEANWFWFVLKTAGFLMFAVLMTCYWTFIDQYHHLQDGKRLFGLFSSTIFLGAASTGVLMNSGLLDLEHLLVVIIVLFITAFYWIKRISTRVTAVGHEDAGVREEETGSFAFLFKSIISSPFTMLLMTSNFLVYLLLVTTEYNYMFTFENYFASKPPDLMVPNEGTEAQLTLFLGRNLALVSIANLLFGLFFYSRFVRRFGIGRMLLITPSLLIMAFTGWLLSPSLVFPLIGFFVVEGTLYVVDDSNFNLLLNAVPSKLKYKIRIMIESFFEPVGMLVSAALLSFFQSNSKMLGLILSGCAFLLGLGLSARYLKAIFSNLAENAIYFRRTIEDWIQKMSNKQQKAAQSRLLAILKSGNEEAQLFACEVLLSFEDSHLLHKLLATKMSIPVKIKLITLLEHSVFAKDVAVLDAAQNWILQDFDPQLKSAVHMYLAKQGLLHPDKVFHDLKSPDVQLQGAAIVALKKSLAYHPPEEATFNRTLADKHLKLFLDSRDENKVCMGLQILGIEGNSHDVDMLISYLRNPSLSIARAAAKSIAQIAEVDAIDSIRQAPQILNQLCEASDNEVRLACLQALGSVNDSSLVKDIIRASLHFRPNERRLIESIIYKMGLRTVPTLIDCTKNTHIPDRCRVLAGRILGRLALPQLRANLSDIIRQEMERAYFYFYHANTIQAQYPEQDLSMLRDVLITDYHSVIDFIIQLLGVAGEVEDVELLSQSLRSRNPKVRSQAVEALEKTCERIIFRQLRPLVDEIPYAEKIRAYLKSGHKPLSLTELLDRLGHSQSQIDQIISATMKYQFDLPNWRESLRQQMSKQDEIFHHFAYELLES